MLDGEFGDSSGSSPVETLENIMKKAKLDDGTSLASDFPSGVGSAASNLMMTGGDGVGEDPGSEVNPVTTKGTKRKAKFVLTV